MNQKTFYIVKHCYLNIYGELKYFVDYDEVSIERNLIWEVNDKIGGVKPFLEKIAFTKEEAQKQVAETKKYYKETFDKDIIFSYAKNGNLSDYTWEYNEEDQTNYGAKK